MKRHLTALTTWILACTATVQANSTIYDSCYPQEAAALARVTDIAFPADTVCITRYGAIGDGQTLVTRALQQAIDDAARKGGGVVSVPQGVWLTGPIRLKSNVCLTLDDCAILQFSPDKTLYVDSTRAKASRVRPCISADKQRNIGITGNGIIDGNGQQWRPVKRSKVSDVEWKQYHELGGIERQQGTLWYPWQMKAGYADIADTPERQESMRNDLVRFEQCTGILLRGVTFQNSPRFHVHPCYSENIIIDGITVRSEWNVQNGDGIDLSDCHRALITRCTVSVGDDGICMKSGLPHDGRISGCEDILIADNTVNHAHGGFVIGSEDAGGMRRITVVRCRFSGTDVGLRFKSALGRGGLTEQIRISDCVMNDISGEAIAFQCDYVNRHAGADTKEPVYTDEERQWAPRFRDIRISRITVGGCKTGIRAAGLPGIDCISDIVIEHSNIVCRSKKTDIDEATAKLTLNNVNLIK